MSDEPKTIHDVLLQALGDLVPSNSGEVALNPETLTVRKLSALIPVTCCAMTDATGVNHCEHPLPPPVPHLTRLRWRLRSRWANLRMRVGAWVAGVDLDRED